MRGRPLLLLRQALVGLTHRNVRPPSDTSSPPQPPDAPRTEWLTALETLTGPLLVAGSERRLVETMPVQARIGVADRDRFSHLEAVARSLNGISPWLESDDGGPVERRRRDVRREQASAMLTSIVDPRSPDLLDFASGPQALVEAAFFSQALLRAPRALWASLDELTRLRIVDALRSTRAIEPARNNWLLFPAMVETFFASIGSDDVELDRIDTAVDHVLAWYLGDGAYGDGPRFRWDYYNSFVIHPMLIDIVSIHGERIDHDQLLRSRLLDRARRMAVVLERMISPEGTYPPIGRSLTYRFGAFHLLAQLALGRALPDSLDPGSVRCALGAVIRRQLATPGSFDDDGWLRIGLAGDQPGLGERYISTGSLYLCTTALLPLGLPADDSFWSSPPIDWTSRRIWGGVDTPADRSLADG